MRNWISAVLALGLVASMHSAAWGASVIPDAQPFAEDLVGFHNWKSLLGELNGLLPNNVVKEYRDEAENFSFPRMRMDRGALLITDARGNRVHMTFGNEGAVFINGKEWKLKPLATAEEEEDRLSDMVGKGHRASLYDHFVPDASAGEGAEGMALVIAQAAARWKAQACRGEKLSDALIGDCALMAVAMKETPYGLKSGGKVRRISGKR